MKMDPLRMTVNRARELERLRAIVRDLAATTPLDGEYGDCVLCHGDGSYWKLTDPYPHKRFCPWLRATQEQP